MGDSDSLEVQLKEKGGERLEIREGNLNARQGDQHGEESGGGEKFIAEYLFLGF